MICITERKIYDFIIATNASLYSIQYSENYDSNKVKAIIDKINEEANEYLNMIIQDSPMFSERYSVALNDIIKKAQDFDYYIPVRNFVAVSYRELSSIESEQAIKNIKINAIRTVAMIHLSEILKRKSLLLDSLLDELNDIVIRANKLIGNVANTYIKNSINSEERVEKNIEDFITDSYMELSNIESNTESEQTLKNKRIKTIKMVAMFHLTEMEKRNLLMLDKFRDRLNDIIIRANKLYSSEKPVQKQIGSKND